MEGLTLLCVVGIFSCVSVIYRNSRKTSKQLEEITGLLRKIADRSSA